MYIVYVYYTLEPKEGIGVRGREREGVREKEMDKKSNNTLNILGRQQQCDF